MHGAGGKVGLWKVVVWMGTDFAMGGGTKCIWLWCNHLHICKLVLTHGNGSNYQILVFFAAYCLYHDSTLHSKDIHATMTDKCCQARSKYRSLNPHNIMYKLE